MSQQSPAKRRRVDYVIGCLELVDDSSVKKKLGIVDRSYKERIVQNLLDFGTLGNAPGQGRPCKYTTEHFHAAHDLLKGGGSFFYSSAELVAYLVECKELPEEAVPAGFMPALKAYLKTHHWSLGYGPRALTFAMSQAHKKGRLEWCLQQRLLINSSSVELITFEDEIIIDQGGRPKGGGIWLVHMECTASKACCIMEPMENDSQCPLSTTPDSVSALLPAPLPEFRVHLMTCTQNPNSNSACPPCARPSHNTTW